MKLNALGIGIRIKQARTAKGWTQAQLAKALKVQRSSVVRWETGLSVPQNIPVVAKVLNQTPEWLLDRADEGPLDVVVKPRRKNKKTKVAKSVVAPKKQVQSKGYKDAAMLEDLLKSWNGSNEASRLVAALLITGNWNYKLKLINRDIAIDESVLKAIRLAGV